MTPTFADTADADVDVDADVGVDVGHAYGCYRSADMDADGYGFGGLFTWSIVHRGPTRLHKIHIMQFITAYTYP